MNEPDDHSFAQFIGEVSAFLVVVATGLFLIVFAVMSAMALATHLFSELR